MFAALSSHPKRIMIWAPLGVKEGGFPFLSASAWGRRRGPPLSLLALLAAHSDLAAALRFSLTISHAHVGHFGAVWGPAPPVAARSPAATRQSCLCLEDPTREFWKRGGNLQRSTPCCCVLRPWAIRIPLDIPFPHPNGLSPPRRKY